MSIIVGAGRAFQRLRYSRAYRRHFPHLDLKDLSLADFEVHAAEVLAEDLAAHFDASDANEQARSVGFLIDGLDRLQARRVGRTPEWALQDFCALMAQAEFAGRCVFMTFGREQLAWRPKFDDASTPREESWDVLMSETKLSGLAEQDARLVLEKHATWFEEQSGEPAGGTIAALLRKHEGALLQVALESEGADSATGPGRYHAYSIALGIEQVIQNHEGFDPDVHLARGVQELQQRFLRNLDADDLRTLQVLAISGEFDAALFAQLVTGHLIVGYAPEDFFELTDSHSYFVPSASLQDGWRFHHAMEEALLSSVRSRAGAPARATAIFDKIWELWTRALRDRLEAGAETEARPLVARMLALVQLHLRSELIGPQTLAAALAGLDALRPERIIDVDAELPVYASIAQACEAKLGDRHPDTIRALERKLLFTSYSRRFREAIAEAEERLAAWRSAGLATSPGVVRMRYGLVRWRGLSGDCAGAVQTGEALLADHEREPCP